MFEIIIIIIAVSNAFTKWGVDDIVNSYELNNLSSAIPIIILIAKIISKQYNDVVNETDVHSYPYGMTDWLEMEWDTTTEPLGSVLDLLDDNSDSESSGLFYDDNSECSNFEKIEYCNDYFNYIAAYRPSSEWFNII
jgi:hypothetical protein